LKFKLGAESQQIGAESHSREEHLKRIRKIRGRETRDSAPLGAINRDTAATRDGDEIHSRGVPVSLRKEIWKIRGRETHARAVNGPSFSMANHVLDIDLFNGAGSRFKWQGVVHRRGRTDF